MEANRYYLVNVPGKHGYSFMVASEDELDDETILTQSAKFELFSDDDDVFGATVSEADDHDCKFFNEFTQLEDGSTGYYND